jgi:hypothetical protein
LVTQSVTAEKTKREGWRPVAVNLVGRKAELTLPNFSSGPPRPEILIYLRLSRLNAESGHSNEDEYRERLAHFVASFLLVRCPVRPAEFFHLPVMAKLKPGPASGAADLLLREERVARMAGATLCPATLNRVTYITLVQISFSAFRLFGLDSILTPTHGF